MTQSTLNIFVIQKRILPFLQTSKLLVSGKNSYQSHYQIESVKKIDLS